MPSVPEAWGGTRRDDEGVGKNSAEGRGTVGGIVQRPGQGMQRREKGAETVFLMAAVTADLWARRLRGSSSSASCRRPLPPVRRCIVVVCIRVGRSRTNRAASGLNQPAQ